MTLGTVRRRPIFDPVSEQNTRLTHPHVDKTKKRTIIINSSTVFHRWPSKANRFPVVRPETF